jgi:RND family efflux transporter MFP subunit
VSPIRLSYLSLFYFLATTSTFAQGAPPTPVRVAPVQEQELQDRYRVTGSLRAANFALVAAQEEGRVAEVLVKAGDRVEAGVLLCRLDSRRMTAMQRSAEADFARATATLGESRARLEKAQRDLDRAERLLASGSVTETTLQDARTEKAVAESRFGAAEREGERLRAQLDLLLVRIQDVEIKAPFAGVVTERRVEVGEWLRPGDPVVRLVSDQKLEAWLEVPERFASSALAAPEIRIEVPGGFVLANKARLIPQVDDKARSFTIVFDLSPSDKPLTLLPGMSVRAAVPTGEKTRVLTVPKDALLREAIGYSVYKSIPGMGGAGSQAVPIGVDLLFEQGDLAAVKAPGLKAGDLVVIEGNERLRPMMSIAPMPGSSK